LHGYVSLGEASPESKIDTAALSHKGAKDLAMEGIASRTNCYRPPSNLFDKNGQTHTDISGTIIGQAHSTNLRSMVKRTTTQAERYCQTHFDILEIIRQTQRNLAKRIAANHQYRPVLKMVFVPAREGVSKHRTERLNTKFRHQKNGIRQQRRNLVPVGPVFGIATAPDFWPDGRFRYDLPSLRFSGVAQVKPTSLSTYFSPLQPADSATVQARFVAAHGLLRQIPGRQSVCIHAAATRYAFTDRRAALRASGYVLSAHIVRVSFDRSSTLAGARPAIKHPKSAWSSLSGGRSRCRTESVERARPSLVQLLHHFIRTRLPVRARANILRNPLPCNPEGGRCCRHTQYPVNDCHRREDQHGRAAAARPTTSPSLK